MPERSEVWLSPKQVARMHGADVSTIYRWVRQGVLRASRRGPHRVVIRLADAQAIIQPVRVDPPVILPEDRAGEAVEALRRRGYEVN